VAEQYNLAKAPLALVSLTHPCAIDTAHKTHPRLSSGASAPLYGVKNPFASGRASAKFSDALHGSMNMDLVFKILGSRGYFCLKSSPSFVRCESSVFCSHSGAISMQSADYGKLCRSAEIQSSVVEYGKQIVLKN